MNIIAMNIHKTLHLIKSIYIKYNINIIKTFRINFSLLPFSQARHLPITVYGKTSLCIGGNSQIIINCKPKYGLLRFGYQQDHQVSNYLPSHFLMTNGTLILNGNADFSPGTTLRIDKGIVSLGENFFQGGGGKLLCCNKITIGDNTWLPFNVIVSDTDFHFYSHEGKIKNCSGEVCIGNNVWIGNSSTIHKGSLPNNCIVASHSLVNKDFSSENEDGLLLAGIPAKIKGRNYYRISSKHIENLLKKEFKDNPNRVISIEDIIIAEFNLQMQQNSD